jgi:ADP-ribosyl-[dinitrogen reductase] hydrolase
VAGPTLDRAAGVLVASAAGDALGVPYEFGRPTGDPQMKGGGLGGLAPGQWSDDTDMACAITRAALARKDLRTTKALDAIAAGFVEWRDSGPGDIGIQTSRVLGQRPASAADMTAIAHNLHQQTGRTAGNGSLMRTAPVALAHLHDEAALIEAARKVSALTHYDKDAQDACVLWCLAIRHTVLTGELDVRVGLPHVDPVWAGRLDEAEAHDPSRFHGNNGWVVAALQGAWSAVHGSTSLQDGLVRAVQGGGDTDTVAAIAGALLGARYGASAVPQQWRRALHGWPGWTARDLTRNAIAIVRGDDADGWPSAARLTHPVADATVTPHPDDDGVLLGTLGGLKPGVADAVVSLCRLGTDELLGADHHEIWLVDQEDANLDAAGVLRDTAELVRDLRNEGRTVYLHCVHGQTRTPLAAAAYGALITSSSPEAALARVERGLRTASSRPSLRRAFLAGWSPDQYESQPNPSPSESSR